MRDDILRALAAENSTPPLTASFETKTSDHQQADKLVSSPPPVAAPIAPLPTRLSFCLPNTNSSRITTPCSPKTTLNNELAICEALESVEEEEKNVVPLAKMSPINVKSPIRAMVSSGGGLVNTTDNQVRKSFK